MARGKVKWFNNTKGYGFLNLDGDSEDYFVHYSSIEMDGYKSLKAGQAVTFEVDASEMKAISQPMNIADLGMDGSSKT